MDKAKRCPAEWFIFSNDDIFLLEPMVELPNYAHGKIADFRGGTQAYMRYVAHTAVYAGDAPYFDVHAPMVMKKTWLAGMPLKTGVLFKSYYGATAELTPTPYRDFKIDHYVHASDIDGMMESRKFLSIGDNCGWPVRRWIMNRWPNKSKWEI